MSSAGWRYRRTAVPSDQVGDAAAVAERLARHGRIILQLPGQQRPEQFVIPQFRHQLLAIGELGDLPAACTSTMVSKRS